MSEHKFDMREIVKHNYVMDPDTEDVLPTGENLRNGMVVLIEAVGLRENLDYRGTSMCVDDEAMITNRWCEVSNLRIWPDGQITFTGIYVGGVKTQRYARNRDAWLVKVYTVPEEESDAVLPVYMEDGSGKKTPSDNEWCSELPQYVESLENMSYVPSRPRTGRIENPRLEFITPRPDAMVVHPPEVRWSEFSVDEMDDLIRWRNAHLGDNATLDEVDAIRDHFEVMLHSGRKVYGTDLKTLFKNYENYDVVNDVDGPVKSTKMPEPETE